MGKCYTLHIVGFVFTPRTVGARIKLSSKHIPLWGHEDESEQQQESLSTHLHNLHLNKSQPVDSSSSCSFGERAHITIACAPGVKPVETGNDQINIINLERKQELALLPLKGEHQKEDKCQFFEHGRCVVYFNKPLNVLCLFSGKYQ